MVPVRAYGGTALAIQERIESAFERWGHLVFRRRWLAIALMLSLAAALSSYLPELRLENDFDSFLHDDDPTVLLYNEFRDQFGWDEYTFIVIEPAAVFDLAFLNRLRALHQDLEAEVPYLDDLTSLVNARLTRGEADELIVEDLMETWPESAEDVAKLRERVLANPLYLHTLISENERFTTITLFPNTYSTLKQGSDALAGFEEPTDGDVAAEDPEFLTDVEASELLAVVRDVLTRYEGPDFKTYLAGGLVIGERMNAAMQSDIARFLVVTMLIILSILYFVFRRASGVLLPLTIILLSLFSTVGIMVMLGIPLSLTTELLPPFILTVGVCDSVHLLVIFYQQLGRGVEREQAIANALAHSGLAVLMTSLTTAGGLASFAAAELAPVAQLGIVAPIGVMLAMVFTLVLLPALLAVVPLRGTGAIGKPSARRLESLLLWFARVSTQRPWTVLAGSALVVGAVSLGATQLEFRQDELSWFPEDEPMRVAMELFDRELKGVMALELIIETREENGLHVPELLRRIEEIGIANQTIHHGPLYIGKTTSVVDVLKETHQALNENRSAFYTVPDDRRLVSQELLLFENSGSDDLEDLVDSQFRKARISMKVPWTDSMLYPSFIEKMQAHFEEILGDEVEFHITGLSPLLGKVFSAVISTMARSYLLAFAIITPLMILLMGSLRRGLLAMVPNLVPVLMTLGIMGWLDIALDMSTLLIGGIILGLAVDDTIHFMHKFRRLYEQSGDSEFAVRETLRTTGVAMLFTSVVLAAGFYVFLLAYMANMVMFGLLTGTAAITAFLADVLLAPALMVLVTRRERQKQVAVAA